jgi:hypothetical protein
VVPPHLHPVFVLQKGDFNRISKIGSSSFVKDDSGGFRRCEPLRRFLFCAVAPSHLEATAGALQLTSTKLKIERSQSFSDGFQERTLFGKRV